MSKLNELIAELCPNGVEYKVLSEIAQYAKNRIDAKDVNENTYVSVENLLQNKKGKTVSNSIPTNGKVIRFEIGDILIGNIRPYLRKIWLSDCTGGTNGDVLTVQIYDKTKVVPKFLYYVLSSEHFFLYDIQNSKGAKMPRGSKDAVMKYKLPVPPLPIQEEIVRILDNFTSLTAELQTELQARQKQYEYYRNQLLEQNLEVQRVPLKTVVKHSCSGGTPKKNNLEYYDNGQIPWIRTQDVKFNEITEVEGRITEKAIQETSAKWIPENCVIVAISGATAGRCAINKIKAATNQHCLNMEIDETKAYYRYVFHVLCSKQTELSEKKQGARGDLNASLILALTIPLPSLEVQKRLANLLDNFDAICSDLNIGLPAEIEARQKQYEYYRDALLSFDCSHSINVEREREREREKEREQHMEQRID